MWVENLEYCFTFEGIDANGDGQQAQEVAERKKKAALLALGGQQLRELYNTLEDNGNTYTAAKNVITNHFKGTKNLTAERYKFFCMRPLSSQETHNQWATRLKTKGKDCEFENMNLKEAIKLVMTLHTPLPKLQTAIIRDDMSYDQMMKLAQSIELANREVSFMKSSSIEPGTTSSQTPEDIDLNAIDINKLAKFAEQKGMRLTMRRQQQGIRKHTRTVEQCRYCGESPHNKNNTCKARGATCDSCGKKNHFAKVCESSKKIHKLAYTAPQDQLIYNPSQITLDAINDYSDKDESYPSTHVKVNVGGNEITMQVDSGADANVIPYNIFKTFATPVQLQPTTAQLKPYNSDNIPIKGSFQAEISAVNKPTVKATFYVSDGTATYSLLGKYTAFDMGILSINVNKLQTAESRQIDEVEHLDFRDMAKKMTAKAACQALEEQFHQKYPVHKEKTAAIVSHYHDVFEGIGKHKYRQVRLHINKDVPPVVQAQRRIPFAHREKLETLLEELEEADVIERVEGPTDWVSNIVITPKTDPSKIRMNVDMTTANHAIKRTRHVIPTLEELRYKLNGAGHFSKLDMNHGYNQFEIEPECRYVTVFYTHQGLRQFKRLTFGTNAAAEVFHNEMANTLNDILQVENIYDDIIVFGKTQREHDLALIEALQRFRDCGLTLGLPKCQFNATSVKFFGVVFSKEGMSPDPAKLEALEALTAPTTVTEVRSLLGMTNFCSTFIPDYANITAPLRLLTCKGHEFNWSEECQTAFDTLIEHLKKQTIMAYFDPTKDTKLTVDGSRKDGLGAILSQKDPVDGTFKPIRFDSRATTKAEKNYSQIEIESLALLFGTLKNHMYLYGLPSYIASTDHRPLLPLYQQAKPEIPARVQRHKLQMQGYNYDLIFEPGSENPSDYMSRHPAENHSTIGETSINLVSNAIMRQGSPDAVSTDEIVQAMQADQQLQRVKEFILQGYIPPRAPDVAPYKSIFQELSIDDSGIILRGERIVVPEALRSRIVRMAHEGHQGIVKTKQLVRSTMWFPGIDKAVEEAVAYCNPCQAATDTKKREPMKPSTLPSQPWQKINADLFGPIEGGNEHIIVVQDTYSRYPAVEIVRSTSHKAVLPALDKIFSQFGIPEYMGYDNGPPFSSTAMKDFASYMGFKHGPKVPLAPWTNGMVENFMHNLGKLLQTSDQERCNWREELQRMLRAYRGTPHTVTGQSPASVLFNGRQYRTRLPAKRNEETPKYHDEIGVKQNARKLAMKKYADNKAYVKECNLSVGDWALVRQRKKTKKDTPYCGIPYQIISMPGHGKVIAQREDGHTVTRHSTFFKKIKNHPGADLPGLEEGRVPPTYSGTQEEDDIEPVYEAITQEENDQHQDEEGDEPPQVNEGDMSEDDETFPYGQSDEDDDAVEEEEPARPTRQRIQPSRFKDFEVEVPSSLKP